MDFKAEVGYDGCLWFGCSFEQMCDLICVRAAVCQVKSRILSWLQLQHFPRLTSAGCDGAKVCVGSVVAYLWCVVHVWCAGFGVIRFLCGCSRRLVATASTFSPHFDGKMPLWYHYGCFWKQHKLPSSTDSVRCCGIVVWLVKHDVVSRCGMPGLPAPD
jgi:hypothetical protein